MKISFQNILILSLVSIAPLTAKTESPSEPAAKVMPNMVVFKYKANKKLTTGHSATESVQSGLKKYGVTKIEPVIRSDNKLEKTSVRLRDIYYLYYSAPKSPFRIAADLAQQEQIEYAEPVYLSDIEAVPNDSLFSQQQYLDNIMAKEAWDVVKAEGSDVVIAIVDGGTDINHPDLKANLWVNEDEIPDNGIDDDRNGFIDDVNGWNFANNSNDPTGLPSTPINASHGTQTAGLACAVTNNKRGIAGASWNAKLMALNVSYTNDNEILYGFYNSEGKPGGILYAAQNGADIISCSWGSLGGFSLFQQDVVNAVTEMGAVVVAAAGNNNSSAAHYPSSYDNVLSVTGTSPADTKIGFSNYGHNVDLAAPGSSIFTTNNGGGYSWVQGTSYSNPIAAGVMALVKALNPDWLGIQIAQQVRVTADNIDAENPSYVEQLGKGRVNAFRAVSETTTPSVRLQDFEFIDENGNGIIEQGEQVDVFVTLKNYLAPATNVALTLEKDDPAVSLGTRKITVSSIGTLEQVRAETPFRFRVTSSAPSGHAVDFTLRINSGQYSDRDFFQITIMPLFGDININNITTTVSSVGRLGFVDDGDNQEGSGFKFKDSNNLLFEGAIIAGTGADRIISSSRGIKVGDQLRYDKDFRTVDGLDLKINTPGDLSDQESEANFEDADADSPLNVRINQQTFAFQNSPDNDFILVRFLIENSKKTPLENFHFGLFFDWDMDGEFYVTNAVQFDDSLKLGYAFDTGGGPPVYVGTALISDAKVHFKAIFNDETLDPSGWGIYDGYTDEEKWQSISGGTQWTTSGPADVSYSIAAGPFNIDGNQNQEIVFALVAGDDLAELKDNTREAKKKWQELINTGVDKDFPQLAHEFILEQNYPNPFNPVTQISYQLPTAEFVELKVYNMNGQLVRTLVRREQTAGRHVVMWDGRNEYGQKLSSGTYLYRLQSGEFVSTRKTILLK